MWERGVDRIADCEILAEIPNTNPPSFYEHTSGANLQSQKANPKVKKVELNDDFEKYKVIFSVNNPRELGTSEMLLEENSAEIQNQSL